MRGFLRYLRMLFFSLLLVGLLISSAWLTDKPGRLIRQGTGAAIYVIDGDTLRIGKDTIRLSAIDAPEYRQSCVDEREQRWPCGQASSQRLAQLILSPGLSCVSQATDRFGRALATCSTDAVQDIGRAMVLEGLATAYDGRGGEAYAAYEREARKARRGVWRGTFDRPREWRRANPRRPVS